MKNYITEDDLKGFIPELTKYLWVGETDYSKQKAKAENIVVTDLFARGYNISDIQMQEILRDAGTTLTTNATETAIEDTTNALRFVWNIAVWSSLGASHIITLEGSNDNSTFETVTTSGTISATGESSATFMAAYKYYRTKATITAGSLDYKAYITEIDYDLLFAYKWLELILMNSYKVFEDQYYQRMIYFQNMYKDKLESMPINQDTNADNVVDEDETNIVFSR